MNYLKGVKKLAAEYKISEELLNEVLTYIANSRSNYDNILIYNLVMKLNEIKIGDRIEEARGCSKESNL
jgi:hypothetical protein